MRDAQTMKSLILEVAKHCDNISVVIMNGSRTNPKVKKDRFQDFDIVYFVKDIDAVPTNHQWLDVFGERLIMQTSEDMVFDPPDAHEGLTYLMQFTDGNRIDLQVKPVNALEEHIASDTLVKVLLDKDGHIKNPPKANESAYYVEKPTESIFASCVNECLWVSLYVVKGVKRVMYRYAIEHLDILRRCLEAMLEWHIGTKHAFKISVGKSGSRYNTLLPDAWFEAYIDTYPEADSDAIMQKLFRLLELFDEVAMAVSKSLGYAYDRDQYHRILDYIKTMDD